VVIARVSQNKILVSALAANIVFEQREQLVAALAQQPEALAIAQTFGSPKLIRELRLGKKPDVDQSWLTVEQSGKSQILCQGQPIGNVQVLYKSPLPGELQARLAIESAIDRFLEYLQKVYQIVVLDESDRHVSAFIPNKPIPDFATLWKKFLKEVAFFDYGKSEFQLPGLVQTFIVMLNAVTLSGRGFSTLDVPILTQEQANVLASWYFAVIRDVQARQKKRQQDIESLIQQLEQPDLSE